VGETKSGSTYGRVSPQASSGPQGRTLGFASGGSAQPRPCGSLYGCGRVGTVTARAARRGSSVPHLLHTLPIPGFTRALGIVPLAMRLLCFLVGHQLGRSFMLLGLTLRSCRRCGTVVSGPSTTT
jgi:hypothetical protein